MKRYFVVDQDDLGPVTDLSSAKELDLERSTLLSIINLLLADRASQRVALNLTADITVDADGETITRIANVMVWGNPPPNATDLGERKTDPPPDALLSSDPEHPRGCSCPKCA